MNIGIVTSWWDCGAGFVSRQILNVLNKTNDVFIYARGEKYEIGNSYWDQDNVHWGSRVFWPSPGRIDKQDFKSWISQKKIDIIIFNEQRWWQPIIWAKNNGVKCGAYIDYYTSEDICNFSAYDFLICNTERHYSVFDWHPGAKLVKWGTNTQLFKPAPKNAGKNIFTYFHSAGRSPYRKGTDLLLKAFDAIKDRINAKLVIHSQIPLNVSTSKKVEIIEKTIGPPGLYHLGDVYVYPSRLDGLGLTVCEALSCGLPVITTDNQPMSEFIIPEYNGLLVRVEKSYYRNDNYYWPIAEPEINSLSMKMIAIYEDRKRINSWKNNARNYAEQDRDWFKNAKLIEDIIKERRLKPLSKNQKKDLTMFDRRGLFGKLDIIYCNGLLRRPVEFIVEKYRKKRQPHLYSAS